MMIGGEDIQLALESGPSADTVGYVLRLLRAVWPEAVVDDVDDERGPRPINAMFPARRFHELLVYRDAASQLAWDEKGATDETNDSMIHILTDDDGLTFVVDTKTSFAGALVAEVIRELRARPDPSPSITRGPNPPQVAPCP